MQLENSLHQLPYIENVRIIPTSLITTHKRRVSLKHEFRLDIYFNSVEFTMSFALIEKDMRVWALDRDNKDDWHIHPLGTVKEHQKIEAQTVKQIIAIFDKMYRRLLFQRLGITLSGWLF